MVHARCSGECVEGITTSLPPFTPAISTSFPDARQNRAKLFGQYYFRLFFMAAYNWKFLLQVPAYNITRVRRSPSVKRTPSAALSGLRSQPARPAREEDGLAIDHGVANRPRLVVPSA